MGVYLNPGNNGFARIIKSDYVDKTGLISLVNNTIDTAKNLTCISRPRRFGKSYAARMLCAYYDRTCDSHSLFDSSIITNDDTYEEHINKYHVINLDITGFISESKKKGESLRDVPVKISEAVKREVEESFTDIGINDTVNDALMSMVNKTGTRIVFIIDEWDAVIRESGRDDEAKERYLNLLRSWFKNGNFTPYAVAAAYMTGILPIKKDGSQSAISDFEEYSVLDPLEFAEYVGFTETEVRSLCEDRLISFERMKKWYDGYTFGDEHSIYNPYSVMQALNSGRFKSYWKQTSAAETLRTYIEMDQDGLQQDIAGLVAGERILVDTDSFNNDVEGFTCKDDVLTLLLHLGYLTYEEIPDSYDDSEFIVVARIPNDEVRSEFNKILRKTKRIELVKLIKRSDKLLSDTLAGDEEAVAKAIQEVRDSNYAPTFYNDEQSLRYAVKMAYLSCVDQYAEIEELPSGRGIADVAFLPKRTSMLPAMVVELKWNKNKESAIRQIKEKNYPRIFEKYGGPIMLVGINYDEKSKMHSCEIERLDKHGMLS